MTEHIPEIVGYLGSALVVVSLTMRSLLRLRVIGLAGSATFLVYGFLIDAIPVVITNAVIMSIHVWFLRKLLGKSEIFSLLRVRPDSDYLRAFLEFHADQIQRFQPGYVFEADDETRIWFILRDLLPAGLFVGQPCTDGTMEILLDYAIPQYRDLKLGTWVFSGRSGMFADDHATTVWVHHWSETHDRYLERMGFEPTRRDDVEVYERAIT